MDNVNATPATPLQATTRRPHPDVLVFSKTRTRQRRRTTEPQTPEAAAPVTPPVTPPAPAKKAYKFKVDDQEVTEELTDDEVLQRLQKHKGADKRFQEAAEIKTADGTVLSVDEREAPRHG
jgi:hypothetical protein